MLIEQSRLMQLPEFLRRRVLQQEVRLRCAKDGKRDWKHTFEWLNNFLEYFAWPDNGEGPFNGRVLAQQQNRIDVLFSDIEPSGVSDVKRRITPRQYFALIDQTMQELGLTEKITSLQRDFLAYRRDHPGFYPEEVDGYSQRLNALYEAMLPVYVELRVKGFTYYDLIR